MQHAALQQWGWTEWFEQKVACEPSESLARVAAVDREQLVLVDQTGMFRARLAGSYLHRHHLAHELPCVGDWVCLEKYVEDAFGIVSSLLPRRTSLRRKMAGNAVEYQMIAANIDVAVIVLSCHFDFNVNRLERYLVMVRDGGAEPCILLTKSDLVEQTVLDQQVADMRRAGIAAPIVTLSNVTGAGLQELENLLLPGQTYCFVGSSGVGKSTLINRLIGQEMQDTKSVSGTGEGRHTTVRRELIRLTGGALVIDNPGMREFGILGAEGGLEQSYGDITRFAAHCRYRNCSHSGEPGCAVVEAVEAGELAGTHLENYVKLKHESDFHQMSYAEKRKKDRDFGKYVKSVKKGLKR